MLRVALTGGIASGKSTAAATFRELGVPVIDTDVIARDLVEPGKPGLDELIRVFGTNILDTSGELDRKRLRERIFADEGFRQNVNDILHPLILADIEQEIAKIDRPYVVVEIPLLTETGLAGEFDRVLVIDAADEVRVKRIRTRDSVTEKQARAALDAQATRDERLALATDVIQNNGTVDALHKAIRELHEKYLAMAKRFASTPRRPSE